jgi:hypothetical protein
MPGSRAKSPSESRQHASSTHIKTHAPHPRRAPPLLAPPPAPFDPPTTAITRRAPLARSRTPLSTSSPTKKANCVDSLSAPRTTPPTRPTPPPPLHRALSPVPLHHPSQRHSPRATERLQKTSQTQRHRTPHHAYAPPPPPSHRHKPPNHHLLARTHPSRHRAPLARSGTPLDASPQRIMLITSIPHRRSDRTPQMPPPTSAVATTVARTRPSPKHAAARRRRRVLACFCARPLLALGRVAPPSTPSHVATSRRKAPLRLAHCRRQTSPPSTTEAERRH